MKLLSSAFAENALIPAAHTCDAQGVSPPLEILDAPAGTKSFALILDDPDAPSGSFLHWLIWNIPAKTTTIAEGTVPQGTVIGSSGIGKPGYFGPCPPNGTHHYRFSLFALDADLAIPASSSRQDVESAMQGHVLAQALLTGLYARQAH